MTNNGAADATKKTLWCLKRSNLFRLLNLLFSYSGDHKTIHSKVSPPDPMSRSYLYYVQLYFPVKK